VRVRQSVAIDPALQQEQPGGAPFMHTEAHDADVEAACDTVRSVRKHARLVVVALHWGIPHGFAARSYGILAEYQRPLAHALVDAGADIVVGHHPHVVHPVERYRNGLIAYSLGNYVFHSWGHFSEASRDVMPSGATPEPVAWPAIVFIVAGAALYVACLWVVASVGRGTPGPWDPPRQFVAVGPYRWVRNPIYIAALLVTVGEAWLFLSLPLVLYAVAAASVVARRAMRISPRHEQRSPSRLSPSVVATAATEPANDSCVVLARGPRHGFRTKVLRSGRAWLLGTTGLLAAVRLADGVVELTHQLSTANTFSTPVLHGSTLIAGDQSGVLRGITLP